MKNYHKQVVVEFMDDEQNALLRDPVYHDGLVTGRRWVGQVEEGIYSYPIHRVKSIKIEDIEVEV